MYVGVNLSSSPLVPCVCRLFTDHRHHLKRGGFFLCLLLMLLHVSHQRPAALLTTCHLSLILIFITISHLHHMTSSTSRVHNRVMYLLCLQCAGKVSKRVEHFTPKIPTDKMHRNKRLNTQRQQRQWNRHKSGAACSGQC